MSLGEADREARSVVLDRMISDTDPFVPYDTGETAESVTPLPKLDGFKYNTPYSSYAFDPITKGGKKKVYSKRYHPKAQGHPFKASSFKYSGEWSKLYAKELFKYVVNQTK